MKRLTKAFSFVLALALVIGLIGVIPEQANAASKKVSISKKTATLQPNATLKLKLKNASGTIKWSVSGKTEKGKAVAKITKSGKVTALREGTATVTATYKKKTYTCEITVAKPTLNNTTAGMLPDETFQLYLNGAKVIKYGVTDKSVISVSKTGEVKALKPGTSTIKVYYKNGKGKKVYTKCVVTVYSPIVEVVPYNFTSGVRGQSYKTVTFSYPSNFTAEQADDWLGCDNYGSYIEVTNIYSDNGSSDYPAKDGYYWVHGTIKILCSFMNDEIKDLPSDSFKIVTPSISLINDSNMNISLVGNDHNDVNNVKFTSENYSDCLFTFKKIRDIERRGLNNEFYPTAEFEFHVRVPNLQTDKLLLTFPELWNYWSSRGDLHMPYAVGLSADDATSLQYMIEHKWDY